MSKKKQMPDWDDFEWEENEESISFADFFQLIRQLFPWIVICSFIGVVISWVYFKTQEPLYTIKSKVLIKDGDKGPSLKNADLFQNLGLFTGASSVDNELEIITTYTIMEKVVNELNLNVSIKKNQFFKSKDNNIYNIPWKTKVLQYNNNAFENNLVYGYTIVTKEDKQWISYNGKEVPFQWNKPFALPVATLLFEKNPAETVDKAEWSLVINKPSQTVESYIRSLEPNIPNKNTSIITLEIKTPNPARDQAMMNKLIDTYIDEGVKDNNSVNDRTLLFINERLREVSTELNNVELDIQNFKQQNQITNIADQAKIFLESTKENSQKLIDAEIQLNVVSSLESHIKGTGNNIIPASLLTQDISLSNLINQYNGVLVQKERLAKSATPDNPFIKNLNTQLSTLKGELLANIGSTKNSYQTIVSKLRSENNENLGQIRKIPQQERAFLDISRQQAIKQELYLYLLKKREETALGKSSTLSNTRIIDYARVVDTPVSPKKSIYLLSGLLLGGIFPFIVSFIRRKTNTKIHTKNDIKRRAQIPIIGEIGHQENPETFEVKSNPRSALAEQFRILRTNLHFYQQKDTCTTIMVTSSLPGEGKTFISLNLAATLAANKEVNVLVIGMDLRKPRLATELKLRQSRGFTDYSVKDCTLEDIIYPLNGFDNLKVMPSGTIPPNPSELLMSKECAQMFEAVKKQYDFIVIDCPPSVVTDYQIISQYADTSLFTVRMEHTEKRQLDNANELYLSEKLPKMCLVVNDLDPEKYDGYNSGYYYQYGYYETEFKKQSLLSKWIHELSKKRRKKSRRLY